MLCGPYALSHTTGIDVQEIILRIRALREQRGERLSLRGGTRMTELQAVAQMYGWRVRCVFRFRRVRVATLAKRILRGRWIFQQSGHFFGVASAKELRDQARWVPNARPILAGYRVHMLTHGGDSLTQ